MLGHQESGENRGPTPAPPRFAEGRAASGNPTVGGAGPPGACGPAARSKPKPATAGRGGFARTGFQGRRGEAGGTQGKQTSAPEAQRAHPNIKVRIVD